MKRMVVSRSFTRWRERDESKEEGGRKKGGEKEMKVKKWPLPKKERDLERSREASEKKKEKKKKGGEVEVFFFLSFGRWQCSSSFFLLYRRW